jgi:hypothetical protein
MIKIIREAFATILVAEERETISWALLGTHPSG